MSDQVITDNTQTLINAEQEIQQLKARVAELEQAAEKVLFSISQLDSELINDRGMRVVAIEVPLISDEFEDLLTVLNESPQQSLASIQADAVSSFKQLIELELEDDDCSDSAIFDSIYWLADKRIKQLRNSKDGE